MTGGLIFHSDRDSQSGSRSYRQLLPQAGMHQSMSARANPYHNAWTESFMGTLKAEMLQNGRFIKATDARRELCAYIDDYYNTQRLHSSLSYQSPASFEAVGAGADDAAVDDVLFEIEVVCAGGVEAVFEEFQHLQLFAQ